MDFVLFLIWGTLSVILGVKEDCQAKSMAEENYIESVVRSGGDLKANPVIVSRCFLISELDKQGWLSRRIGERLVYLEDIAMKQIEGKRNGNK